MGANGRTLGRSPLLAVVPLAPECWPTEFFGDARAAVALTRLDVHDLSLASNSPSHGHVTGVHRSPVKTRGRCRRTCRRGTSSEAPTVILLRALAANRHVLAHEVFALSA